MNEAEGYMSGRGVYVCGNEGRHQVLAYMSCLYVLLICLVEGCMCVGMRVDTRYLVTLG